MTLLFYGLFLYRSEKTEKFKKRLSYYFPAGSHDEPFSIREQELSEPFLRRLKKSFLTQSKERVRKNMSDEEEEKLETRLEKAGKPFGFEPLEFRLLQFFLSFLLPLVFVLWGWASRFSIVFLFFLAAAGLLVSVILPKYYLTLKTNERARKATRELSDMLDLLTVSLEAGLGFDSALSKVVTKNDGVLSGEFKRALEEMRLGKTRRESLSGVRDRLDADEVKTLISSIIQAEKLGVGMVGVLRAQGESVREMRKQRAEEQAMKAPVKMLFPLVFFIFPSLFIVLLGPAVIQFLQEF
jgi:tight adherence protein C